MDNCLLIGNGFNRCYVKYSWNTLLKQYAEENDISFKTDKSIPLPLEFERLINVSVSQGRKDKDSYKSAKKTIAKNLENVINQNMKKGNSLYKRLLNLNIDSIITTNYDYILEDSLCCDRANKYCAKQKKYLNNSTSKKNNISIFHPHGHIEYPDTMCVGYIHYYDIIKKVIYLISFEESDSNKSKNSDKPSIFDAINGLKRIEHWAARFFDSNIAIVGFGFDISEIDFWWLLTKRAQLKNIHNTNEDKVIRNSVVFYDVETENDENAEEKDMKHKLLADMGVYVKKVKADGKKPKHYKEAYGKIITDIEKFGIRKDTGIETLPSRSL